MSFGCGVQAGGSPGSKVECGSINRFADTKIEMDAIDRRIDRLRPAIDDLEDARALAAEYREAESSYNDLLERSTSEHRRARSAEGIGEDLIEAWDTLVRSLRIRREGLGFFAELFEDPRTFDGSSFENTAADLQRRTLKLNDELQTDIEATLDARGFERRADGTYRVDC